MIPLSINLLSDNLLLLASLLVFAAILVTKVGSRLGAPFLLLFLLIGMLAGKDGIGLHFDNYGLAESIGHFAMTVILFTGGMETSWSRTRTVFRHGIVLAIAGVFLTTILTACFIYLTVGQHIGSTALSMTGCLLVAAIMSPTDSASVFSILRGKHLRLRENLGPMLELESGSNDPIAYILTIMLVGILSAGGSLNSWALFGKGALNFFIQLAVGCGTGLAIGYGGKWLLEKIRLGNTSLYAILILSIGFLANGLASLFGGNGLLALYVAAIFIGNNTRLADRKNILKFFDGLTWLMQLVMFLMLGLLARPSQMPSIAIPALLIGLFLILVARPASVFLSLLPFRSMSTRAKIFTSWVGLKGSGPILFAMAPVIAGFEGAEGIFNVVFLVSLLSLVLQGFSLPAAARVLKLSYDADPKPETFGLDVPEEMGMVRDHVIQAEDLANGSTLRDLHLPHGIRVMMIRRGEHFLVPHGSMPLEVGDQLIIILGESDD